MIKGMGSKIKDLLDSQGLRVTDLAQKSGIPVNTLYSMLKRDQTNEKIETLQKIADALEISLSDLLGQTTQKETINMDEQMREQFKLLVEASMKTKDPFDLAELSKAMVEVYKVLKVNEKQEKFESDLKDMFSASLKDLGQSLVKPPITPIS